SLAEELRKRDKGDEAVELLIDGIGKNPDFLAARLRLGRWYLQGNKFAEALEQFAAVLERAPDNNFARKGLAEANRALGNISIVHHTPAPTDRIPEPFEPVLSELVEGERLIALGHYAPAMELYKEMLMKNPDDKRILQRKEELAALISFLGKNKQSIIKRLNRFLEAIKTQFAQKTADA
ncbi:MAG TPA: tetratricopeptide repeat protein, partial [Dissulfurispiraceae bacterium]|nr:tetratricopeptide repeat protein [Dissulfurispiraceae bacterium]